MPQIKSKAIKKGDVIGIITPASPPRSLERVEKSVRYFEQLGYRVEVGKHVADNAAEQSLGYLAASDKDRLTDLHAMFRNKHVTAMFYHRGGFGSIRLLDAIDYELIRKNPKIVVGYSDATALFMSLHKKAGLASCFFGPMPGVDLWGAVDPFSEANLWQALTTATPIGALPLDNREAHALFGAKSKIAQGRMIGGNLAVFSSLLGTEYQPSFRTAIPFFEEIDEKPRKIDALFAQLRLAGLWRESKAVLLGQFTNCNHDPDAVTRSLNEIVADYFGKLGVPVISGLPFGHEARKWTLAFGAKLRVTVRANAATVEVMDSPLV